MTEIVEPKKLKKELVKYNWLSACLIRAFDVGEAQQKLYHNIHTEGRSLAKSQIERIIVAEKDLKRICKVDTDKAIGLMENILDGIESRDTEKLERLIINHDTEIVETLRKAEPVVLMEDVFGK